MLVADEQDVCSVLVVEDDHDIRNALLEFLEFQGFRARAAVHGAEAMELLRSDDDRPSLILLDLMMPIMNGWEFRERQQMDERLNQIPVVVVSADSQLPDKARALGASDWIAKPIDVNRLLDVLDRYCRHA